MCVIIVLLVNTAIFGQVQDSIYRYNVDQFSIESSVEFVTISNDKIILPLGVAALSTYYHKSDPDSDDPNSYYSINVTTFDDDIVYMNQDSLAAELFTESLNMMSTDLDAKLQYSSENQVGDLRTSTARFLYDRDRLVMKTKLILRAPRFYVLQVFTSKENALNDEMDNFFGSFRLDEL